MNQWTDALTDASIEADALKWQQERADALTANVSRQNADCDAYRMIYADAEREANSSASGLVNALGMVVLIGMGIVFLLTVLWVCGAPWAGVW